MPATLADIARETGFALSSVADVLRGRPGYKPQTRQIILDAARRLDFVPNHLGRSLKAKRSKTIGVAARMVNATNTGVMLHTLAHGLLQHGFMPLFAETSGPDEGETAAIRELRARSVDGIIINGDLTEQALSQLIPPSVPVVMIRSVDQPGRPSVVADRFEAYQTGVRWLAERGHRRIAFVGSEWRQAMDAPFNSLRLKVEGYVAAMRELGLYDPDLMIETPFEPGGAARCVAANRQAFSDITAVLAGNDCLAIEVMSGLHDLGLRVPEDCWVIGFDNTPFATAVRPTLSTFNPRHLEVGARAVQMMMDLLDGKTVESVRLVPELVLRQSVRAAP